MCGVCAPVGVVCALQWVWCVHSSVCGVCAPVGVVCALQWVWCGVYLNVYYSIPNHSYMETFLTQVPMRCNCKHYPHLHACTCTMLVTAPYEGGGGEGGGSVFSLVGCGRVSPPPHTHTHILTIAWVPPLSTGCQVPLPPVHGPGGVQGSSTHGHLDSEGGPDGRELQECSRRLIPHACR